MSDIKCPPPRQLQHEETLASLDSFQSSFKLYFKRSKDLKEFFRSGASWDPARHNYGLTDTRVDGRVTVSADEKADNLEILLTQLGSFLPFPFLTPRFQKETKNWEDAFNILYQHYGVLPSQKSFLQYSDLKKKSDETPLTFYERLCHMARAHLAPAGATANGITNTAADEMSISLLNHVALDWVKELGLRDVVETEFGNELKSGTQLAALVPRIAHQVDTLLKRHGQASANRVSTETDISNGSQQLQQQDYDYDYNYDTDQVMYIGPGQARGIGWRPSRGQGRWARPSYSRPPSGRGGPTRGAYQPLASGRQPYCPGCKMLGQELRLRVDFSHLPADCPRKRMAAAANLVYDEPPVVDFPQAEDRDLNQAVADMFLNGHTQEVSHTEVPSNESFPKTQNSLRTFRIQQQHQEQPTSEHRLSLAPDTFVFNNTVQSDSLTTTSCSNQVVPPVQRADCGESYLDQLLAKIRRLEETRLKYSQSNPQIRKAKSPTVEADMFGTKIICTVDEGSELICMDHDVAVKNNVPFTATRQTAAGAGSTKMTLMGETISNISLKVNAKKNTVHWNLGKVIIVKNLGVPLLIGEPGKRDNKIITIPQEVIITRDISGNLVSLPYHAREQGHTSGFKKHFLCSVPETTVLYPWDSVSIPVPSTFVNNVTAITPRVETDNKTDWLAARMVLVKKDTIQLQNTSNVPVMLNKGQPFAELRDTYVPPVKKVYDLQGDKSHFILPDRPNVDSNKSYINDVRLDPDQQLSPDCRNRFLSACHQFSHVITPIPGRYNGYYGHVDNSLNFVGTPPPSIKARLPKYNNEMLQLMAKKMDELEDWGVLAKPESLGVVPKHVVPSMLLPKTGCPGEYRLVSDFTSLLPHIKKLETVAPSLKDVKTKIGQAKYHVELDFSNYFWQGGMPIEDIPYLATPHPFGGLRVYTVEPQGIRNASEHGAERLSRIYGDMVKDGHAALIADALYILADDEESLLQHFVTALSRASLSGLTFKPSKLIIAPRTTTIFGWKKTGQSWLPCSHIFSPLSKAPPPTTVKKMRSFLGAFKQLNECIKNHAVILDQLEKVCANKDSKARIVWDEALLEAFNKAKVSLKDPKAVAIPRPDDVLHLHPDFSQELNSCGGPMYIMRKEGDKTVKLLGGHFNVKLKDYQARWLPCEGESLAAKLIVNHFSHYIRESKNTTIVFTDNQPLAAAFKRLKQGEFSNSSRIASFLTSMCVHDIEIRYYPGKEQKVGDFYSRNPIPCEDSERCQICQFAFQEQDMHPPKMYVASTRDGAKNGGTVHPPVPARAGPVSHHRNGTDGSAGAVGSTDLLGDDAEIKMVTYEDVITGRARVPFTERPAWISVQAEDQIHQLLTGLIKNGQKPEKKQTNRHFTQLKKMYNLYQTGLLLIARDGLVTVRHTDARGNAYNAISVPAHMFPGLIQALHVKLSHPSKAQLLRLVSRYFYCPNMAQNVDQVVTNCSVCTALRTLPQQFSEESTTMNDTFGAYHSADVIKQNCQLIFISREKLTQFVYTKLIPDESANSIREALLAGCIELLPQAGGCIQVDPGSSLQTLAKEAGLDKDSIFKRFNIKIDLGRTHNINKNPVAENAVKEFLKERLRLDPNGGPITETDRIVITKMMNTRIRDRGVSAKEMMFRRDLVTNEPLQTSDKDLAQEQFEKRKQSHNRQSEKEKKVVKKPEEKFNVGDRVYIKHALSKIRGREEHRIIKLFRANEIDWATVKKSESQFRNKEYDVKCSEIIKVPFSQQPVTQQPVTEQSEAQQPELKQPQPQQSQPQQPETQQPETQQPELQQPVARQRKPQQPIAQQPEPANQQTRSGRQRRLPSHLTDYVLNVFSVPHYDEVVKARGIKTLHGWSYQDWIDLDDDDLYSDTTIENHTTVSISRQQDSDCLALVTSSDPDIDLIDFQTDITLSEVSLQNPAAVALDQMVWEQIGELETSVRCRIPATSSPTSRHQPNNISADWADTSSIQPNTENDTVKYDEIDLATGLRHVILIARQLNKLEDEMLKDYMKNDCDADGEKDLTSGSDLCDDENDADDEDNVNSSSDEYEPPPTSKHSPCPNSDRTGSPPTSRRRRRPPSNWRGDSPRPGTVAALLTTERLRIDREEIIRRRRQSSTWDNLGDIATPVTADPPVAGNGHDGDESEEVFSPAAHSFVFPDPRNGRLHGRRHIRTLRRRPRVDYKTLSTTGAITYKHSSSSGTREDNN